MGVVLLLVMLPAMAVLGLVLSVFDGVPAVAMSAMVLGALGTLVYQARGWDASPEPRRTKPGSDETTTRAESRAWPGS
jgi:hypothetical protein